MYFTGEGSKIIFHLITKLLWVQVFHEYSYSTGTQPRLEWPPHLDSCYCISALKEVGKCWRMSFSIVAACNYILWRDHQLGGLSKISVPPWLGGGQDRSLRVSWDSWQMWQNPMSLSDPPPPNAIHTFHLRQKNVSINHQTAWSTLSYSQKPWIMKRHRQGG